MKKGKFTALTLLGGALIFPIQAEKVQFDELPDHLRERIRAHTGSAQIEDIDRGTRNGQTTYEVAFKRNGKHTELLLDERGNPVSTGGTPTAESGKIAFSEVPEAVRRATESRLRGAAINDVDRRVRDGQTTYEIGFKVNDGPQQELLVTDDGTIVRDVPGTETVSQSRTATLPRSTTSGPSQGRVFTQEMRYEELPSRVRSVSDARLREGHVNRVERKVQNGDIRYDIQFDKEDGRTQELVIAEDGRVVRDQFMNRTAIGAPGQTDVGTGSSATPDYSQITSPVRLSNSERVDVLPSEVRRAIQQRAVNHQIDRIERGEWRGRTVYQLGLRDQNNRYSEMQLDGNGRVIYAPETVSERGILQPFLDQFRQNLND